MSEVEMVLLNNLRISHIIRILTKLGHYSFLLS